MILLKISLHKRLKFDDNRPMDSKKLKILRLTWLFPLLGCTNAQPVVSSFDLATALAEAPLAAIEEPEASNVEIANPGRTEVTSSSVTISGACHGNLSLTISGSGVEGGPLVIRCAEGSFSQAITLSAGDGVKAILVTQVDAKGQVSTSQTEFSLDASPPSPPGAISLGATPTDFKQSTPLFTFADSSDGAGSGLAGYRLEIRKSKDDSLVKDYVTVPGDGTVGLSYSEATELLTGGESYYVRIIAMDRKGNESAFSQSPPWTAILCPQNFIAAPAVAPYTSLGFCVAKYEMKIKGRQNGEQDYSSSFEAESRPTGTPWTKLNRNEAISECRALGADYDLISNKQWQSLAQNSESQSENWEGGLIGVTGMFQGHSDNSPDGTLAADPSDVQDPYFATLNDLLDSYGSGREQKRTLTLSNGEVIWDLAGNVKEWMKDDNSYVYGASDFQSQITLLSHPAPSLGELQAKIKFGPAGDYTNSFPGPIFGGLGFANLSLALGAVNRGGYYNSGYESGVFYVDLDNNITDRVRWFGFRCVYSP